MQYEEDTLDTAHPVPKVRFSSSPAPRQPSLSSSSATTAPSSEWGKDDETPSHIGVSLTCAAASSVQSHQDSLISPREVQTHVVEPRDQMEHLQRAFALNGRISSDTAPLSGWESDGQPMMVERPLSPEEKRDLFQEKRRRHYNEFLVMKQLREAGQLTDDDDDDEEAEEEVEERERQLRFQEKRRQHYEEFLVMRRLREMGQLDEESEGEEEEEEEDAMQL